MDAREPSIADDGAAWERTWKAQKLGRFFAIAIPIVLVANTLIAGFLYLLIRQDFWHILLQSHTIGWSILLLHLVGHWLLRGRHLPHWIITAVALPIGAALGLAVIHLVGQGPRWSLDLQSVSITAAATIVFGVAMTYFFESRERIAAGAARLQEELLAREEAARRLVEAELKLLQAQIEPHFLFNTLSNVLQLVDGDPSRAKRMLRNLTSYLRGSLGRTRAGATTLGEELDLIRAYLEIQEVRMGSRLAWRIDCPDELRTATLPPLLLQPLVENALRHGIEPAPGGGEVAVSVERAGAELLLEVTDDGPGLDPHRPAGVGLSNVRERVRAVSGGRGSLSLHPVPSGGLCVRITLPLDAAAPPAQGAGA